MFDGVRLAIALHFAMAMCVVLGLASSPPSFAASAAAQAVTAPNADRVRDALVARLALSSQVAQAKFVTHQPIEDAAREAVVVTALGVIAAQYGIDQDSATPLSRALIAAAKAIQRAQFENWSQGPPPSGPTPDLTGNVRPAIDRISKEFLRDCALELSALQSDEQRLRTMQTAVQQLGVDRDTAAALIRAIVGLRYRPLSPAESHLDFIIARGELRVGLTGDYAPFSYWQDHKLVGIDVDLASDLAQSLGVALRFVPTTWSSLTSDLMAQRFDIALGGITRTLPRARSAMFSNAYFVDGKGAIAPCSIVTRFPNFTAIDQPSVRVIVNPGGTNEHFVRDHISHATITVHPDNITIFAALATGAADVMITDLVEARYQAAHNPKLCVALGEQALTTTDKAALLPRDNALKEYVDLWLLQGQLDGHLDAAVSRYLPTTHPSRPHAAPAGR